MHIGDPNLGNRSQVPHAHGGEQKVRGPSAIRARLRVFATRRRRAPGMQRARAPSSVVERRRGRRGLSF